MRLYLFETSTLFYEKHLRRVCYLCFSPDFEWYFVIDSSPVRSTLDEFANRKVERERAHRRHANNSDLSLASCVRRFLRGVFVNPRPTQSACKPFPILRERRTVSQDGLQRVILRVPPTYVSAHARFHGFISRSNIMVSKWRLIIKIMLEKKTIKEPSANFKVQTVYVEEANVKKVIVLFYRYIQDIICDKFIQCLR